MFLLGKGKCENGRKFAGHVRGANWKQIYVERKSVICKSHPPPADVKFYAVADAEHFTC